MPIDTIVKNCADCGRDFQATLKARKCPSCRKPVTRRPVNVSKHLTLRQKQLVALVAEGKLNKIIAFELHLSERTIKTYLSVIFEKLGVANRTELAVWALRQQTQSQ